MVQITLFFNYPLYGLACFCLGVFGVCILRRNILIVLMSLELILFGVNLLSIYFSAMYDDIAGQIFALVVLTIAAAESSIGLAVLVIYYRMRGHIELDPYAPIKG